MISHPHPNPFAANTYITVTVSGNKLPDNFEFELIDLNGKLVREFQQDELPPFFIGTNTISWNGTDANGNGMVNGMYLFKLSLSIDGKQIEKRGKIVLAR